MISQHIQLEISSGNSIGNRNHKKTLTAKSPVVRRSCDPLLSRVWRTNWSLLVPEFPSLWAEVGHKSAVLLQLAAQGQLSTMGGLLHVMHVTALNASAQGLCANAVCTAAPWAGHDTICTTAALTCCTDLRRHTGLDSACGTLLLSCTQETAYSVNQNKQTPVRQVSGTSSLLSKQCSNAELGLHKGTVQTKLSVLRERLNLSAQSPHILACRSFACACLHM